jgi:hypothetical protein
MDADPSEHTLAFLLAFDGRRHWYEKDYHMKFEIKPVEVTRERPHGLRYSFTLHDPSGKRILGFDNAHAAPNQGGRRSGAVDHWHRTGSDPGRPSLFKDAATLVEDFFDEVERVLTGRGISLDVVRQDQVRNPR